MDTQDRHAPADPSGETAGGAGDAGREDARESSAAPSAAQSAAVREDRSISLLQANFQMVLVAVPAVLLLAVPYVLLWGWSGVAALFTGGDLALLVGAIVLGIVVHEAIHGITWMRAARKPFGVIRFGFDWKTVTPYAHCTEPMRADAYRIGAAMPLLLMGVLPALAGIVTGDAALMGFGLFFTFAAGGDMLILWTLRGVPRDALVEDHPSRAGCYVWTSGPDR